jgi:hypothetical protein
MWLLNSGLEVKEEEALSIYLEDYQALHNLNHRGETKDAFNFKVEGRSLLDSALWNLISYILLYWFLNKLWIK